MTSRQARFTIAVLALLLLVLTGCNKAEQPKPNPQPAPPAGGLHPEAVNVSVVLVYNGGNCVQYMVAAPTPFPPIHTGDTVTWTAKNQFADAGTVPFDVEFPASPFPIDFNSPNATPVTSGPVNGTPNAYYHYVSVTINNNSCNNPDQLGFVMR